MNGSVRTAVKTGVAALAVSTVAVAPVVLPLPEARTVAIPSPTSTKYTEAELSSVTSDIASLLAPPVNLVTGAINGAIGLYYPVINTANIVVPWVSAGVSFIPVVGPPISGQININYALISGLGNSIAPFASSIVSVPANFLNQVAGGVPVGSALWNEAIEVVNASIALGTGVGFSLYNWGVAELGFFTGIYIPPVTLSVPTAVEQQRVLASEENGFAGPSGGGGPVIEKQYTPLPANDPAPENPNPTSPPAGDPPNTPDGPGTGSQDDNQDKKDPPKDNTPTTTTNGVVSAQGEVRGGGQVEGNQETGNNDPSSPVDPVGPTDPTGPENAPNAASLSADPSTESANKSESNES